MNKKQKRIKIKLSKNQQALYDYMIQHNEKPDIEKTRPTNNEQKYN